MGVYIKNWSLADWKELLKWAKIGANNAMIGEFTEVEEVPDHGRLIDADSIKKRISYMNMEAYMDGACYGIHPSLEYLDLLNEILDEAPTIIPADKEGE